MVQRSGETNRKLQAALEGEGAEVIEIVTYSWALPEDTAPLLKLIDALGKHNRRSSGHLSSKRHCWAHIDWANPNGRGAGENSGNGRQDLRVATIRRRPHYAATP